MNPVIKKFQFGQSTVTLETGRIARQASGAVLVTVDDDVSVLVTVVGAKQADPGKGFFPLSVHYQEKTYAAGKIPGGFFKREGRPSEKETLTSRLIDRPIRPLFPEGFMNEVQVVCTVLSTSKKTDPDVAAMIGTSAALAISGIPFDGPIGAARVAFHESTGYLLNPTYEQLAASSLDMVVAGTSEAVLMVESEAKELTEDQMLGAVLFAHDEFQVVIQAVKELAAEAAKPTWDWSAAPEATELLGAIRAEFGEAISQAYTITVKHERYARLGELRDQVVAKLSGEEGQPSASEVKAAFGEIEYRTVRENIVNGKPRIDGRDTKTVRPLNIEVGVLPKTHGSALFTRGETQALVVATLGTARDAQLLDTLEGEKKDPFMTTRLEEIQRRTDLSVTHVTKAVFPPTTNHHNTLFGGTALAWMDEVSFITATRFCRLPLVTVSTDRIDFNHAIPAGSIVELIGRVIKVGNTSLKVEVEVFVESMSADGREKAIQGVFSFVAIDDDKRPVPVLPGFVD